jgi:methylmalonyl-CoA mutase C-terminal domain/subunit
LVRNKYLDSIRTHKLKREAEMAETKPIRVLTYTSSLEGHWRGIAVVTAALRDAGMEVIYGGPLTPEEAAKIAIQEDVDVVGISIGGRYKLVERLFQILKEKNFKPLVVAGGTIPPPDIQLLKEMGIAEVFPPGSRLDSIVNYIREHAPTHRTSQS